MWSRCAAKQCQQNICCTSEWYAKFPKCWAPSSKSSDLVVPSNNRTDSDFKEPSSHWLLCNTRCYRSEEPCKMGADRLLSGILLWWGSEGCTSLLYRVVWHFFLHFLYQILDWHCNTSLLTISNCFWWSVTDLHVGVGWGPLQNMHESFFLVGIATGIWIVFTVF